MGGSTVCESLLGQVQLDSVLLGKRPRPGSKNKSSSQVRHAPYVLAVPQHSGQFGFGRSSRGKKVLIPDWVTLDGVRYDKLAYFPNADTSTHAGAHGCVAAYAKASVPTARLAELAADGIDESALPERLALKCVPYGTRAKAKSSPWANEWRIHNYLRDLGKDNASLAKGITRCLGGVLASSARSNQVYSALELLDTDLFTMIESSNGKPNFGLWILRALRSACLALSGLHKSGIVYCDLKPENVLVNIDSAECKFGDFDRSVVPGISLGTVGGTKGYYSPERMRNSGVHTVQDDTWAFGVLILISATTAASPYLDLSLSNVHKFVPSHYLRRYTRCKWPTPVARRVGRLCDSILRVNKTKRCTLDHIVDEFTAAIEYVSELESPRVSRLSVDASSRRGPAQTQMQPYSEALCDIDIVRPCALQSVEQSPPQEKGYEPKQLTKTTTSSRLFKSPAAAITVPVEGIATTNAMQALVTVDDLAEEHQVKRQRKHGAFVKQQVEESVHSYQNLSLPSPLSSPQSMSAMSLETARMCSFPSSTSGMTMMSLPSSISSDAAVFPMSSGSNLFSDDRGLAHCVSFSSLSSSSSSSSFSSNSGCSPAVSTQPGLVHQGLFNIQTSPTTRVACQAGESGSEKESFPITPTGQSYLPSTAMSPSAVNCAVNATVAFARHKITPSFGDLKRQRSWDKLPTSENI